MPAARQEIRDAVQSAVVSSNVASSRVYIGRQNVLPNAAAQFPVAYVYTPREEIDTQTMGGSGRFQFRMLTVAVDYFDKQSSPELLEEAFDTATAAIEAAVLASTTLGGKCEDILLTSCEYIYEGAEDQPFGRATLQFTVKYFSNEP